MKRTTMAILMTLSTLAMAQSTELVQKETIEQVKLDCPAISRAADNAPRRSATITAKKAGNGKYYVDRDVLVEVRGDYIQANLYCQSFGMTEDCFSFDESSVKQGSMFRNAENTEIVINTQLYYEFIQFKCDLSLLN